MQVILKESLLNLGKVGERVDVKNGYARNFLIPKNKALPVTKENLVIIEQQMEELKEKEKKIVAEVKLVAKKIEELGDLEHSVKVTEEDRLFGAVHVLDVINILKNNGFDLDKRMVNLVNGPFRELGTYEVMVTLHPDVQVKTKLNVVAEK